MPLRQLNHMVQRHGTPYTSGLSIRQAPSPDPDDTARGAQQEGPAFAFVHQRGYLGRVPTQNVIIQTHTGTRQAQLRHTVPGAIRPNVPGTLGGNAEPHRPLHLR